MSLTSGIEDFGDPFRKVRELQAQVQRLTERITLKNDVIEGHQLAIERLTEERDQLAQFLKGAQGEVKRLAEERDRWVAEAMRVEEESLAALAAKDDALRPLLDRKPLATNEDEEQYCVYCLAVQVMDDWHKDDCPWWLARTALGATQKEETTEGWVEVDGRWYNPFPAQKEETNG